MGLQRPKTEIKQAVMLDLKATDKDDLHLDSLRRLAVEWSFYDQTEKDDVEKRIKGKEIVVTNKVVLDRAVLERSKGLRLICVSATGTNNVDLNAARELGIDVCNVTSYATPSVVQYVFTVMLNLMSRIPEYQQAVTNGDWSKSTQFCLLDFSFHELQGKTLGIVGYGELGKAVSNVAKAFGMNVLLAARDKQDNRKGRLQLEKLLPLVDVLSLHCPLTKETENLISNQELNLLPKGAILINSARGGIVDEQALLDAINSGHLAGAAIDVLTIEPPPEDHILLKKEYKNLIVTPHIAWASVESRQRLIESVAFNIAEYLAGKPSNIVNYSTN